MALLWTLNTQTHIEYFSNVYGNLCLEETNGILFSVARKITWRPSGKNTRFPQVVIWNAVGKSHCLSQNEENCIGSIYSNEVLTETFANKWICGVTIYVLKICFTLTQTD